jgi:alpha-amylase/alpha-mannosidase (GH57 family)
MVEVLKDYPKIKLTFNMVPSLIEQIEEHIKQPASDRYFTLSFKKPGELTEQDKRFIIEHFFQANIERMISVHPRFYELYFKNKKKREFGQQDILDLQVWFNLAWIDPLFRENISQLKNLVRKGRFFVQEEKEILLNKHKEILSRIVPAYKAFQDRGQIEIMVSPFYHPILPLLLDTDVARECQPENPLPKTRFSFPEDVAWQIDEAVKFHRLRFGVLPCGMWPSELAVSRHILDFVIKAGINWIVADEVILFRSLKKRRQGSLLYRPYVLKTSSGWLQAVFRDKNLSDLISFVYHRLAPREAVDDFMTHLNNIASAFKKTDALVTVALDGENAWEYYPNDGIDFLRQLYENLSNQDHIKTVTVSEYLKQHPPRYEIKNISTGSWINGNFSKWIGARQKNLAWEYLGRARQALAGSKPDDPAWRQLYIAQGSDWFWWLDEGNVAFESLFRRHLLNFYSLIQEEPPDYLNHPI